MEKLKKIFFFLFFIGLSLPISAFHIIGGVITYECTGPGQYHFTMKIYRDCSNPNGDWFDQNAPISVFKGEVGSLTPITNFYAFLQPITTIPPDANPCLIVPPGICVQEGVYEWDLDLPIEDETYHIAYQRCCRNSTINNIPDPDETGATFQIQLNPAAQNVCNNSPVFNNFPPIVICANQPLEFDHSATDVDGDQLVYELCESLEGAGTVGFILPGDPTSCEGYRPDPACAPPYNSVDYLPPYSALNPLGGSPPVTIDPITGIITGTPTTQGQFVVGVCVKEFRNGELLSIVQRDFQFNVTTCQPTVFADMVADSTFGDNNYVINSCDTEIFIENQSFQQNFIDDFVWAIEIDGQIESFTDWDFENTFASTGTYNGQLLLNPGTPCNDTANIVINIFPDLTADFTFEYDTCVSGPVNFIDESNALSGNITTWDWNFGDGNSSDFNDPVHFYETPGFHDVSLMIIDENGCETSISKTIQYQPIPALIVIAPSTFKGCKPANIFFNNLSVPIDDTYQINWEFGDGNIGTAISPTHLYEETGIYDIYLEIISPIGCRTEKFFPEWIEVFPSPTADFSFDPTNPSNLNPTVQFTDESIDAISWFWDFNGNGISLDQHPNYTFPDTGLQEIQLVVRHPEGCLDTIVQYLDVEPKITYHLPNAFTPNEDTVNDFFKGKGILPGITHFNLQIWDRWGQLFFETNSPNEAWNGRHQNSGRIGQAGVYVVLVNFVGPRGGSFEYKGFATLIR